VVDGPSLIAAAKEEGLELEFVAWNAGGQELLLIINACPKACAARPAFGGPTVEVAGNTVNGRSWPADALPGQIVKTIRETGG